MSPAASTQQQVVTYTPLPSADEARDLLLLEQEEWKNCGELTWGGLVRYMRDVFSVGATGSGGSYVDCCGYGSDLRIPLYVYELAENVAYDLRATAGELDGGELETIQEKDTASFALTREVDIRHPAGRIIKSRWLTGPWTTGGAELPPALRATPLGEGGLLSVEGRTVRSPIPLFGLVELTLEVRRWRHILNIRAAEAEELLVNGWAEFAVALVDGGRPVGLEITPPPGAEELAKNGEECGRGSHYKQTEPEDEEPVAQPEDKIIRCEYCEAKCDDPDEEGDE